MGLEDPLIGAGLSAFSIRTGDVYPHNVFLEIFAEGGCIGLLLFLAMLGATGLMFWQHRDTLNTAAVAAFVLILVASQFSGDLYDSRGLFLFPILAIVTGTGRTVVRPMSNHPGK
jgi:O-antigen ligase